MIDRKKVLKGLEHCISDDEPCVDCPYKEKCIREGWIVALQKDALELLKEQEPVKPVVNVDEWVCGCCGLSVEQQRMIHPGAIFHDFFEYCPHCGKKVDWEAVKQDG